MASIGPLGSFGVGESPLGAGDGGGGSAIYNVSDTESASAADTSSSALSAAGNISEAASAADLASASLGSDLTKVQSSFAIHGNTAVGPVTLGGAPTPGNLIVALLGMNIDYGTLLPLIDTTKWTIFDAAGAWRFTETTAGSFGDRCHMIALYRYVVGGDGATLPAFLTSGTTVWTHAIWEVSGVSGNWADDLLFSFAREDIDENLRLPNLPSVAEGSLALTSVAVSGATVDPSISGSWNLDFATNGSVPGYVWNLGAASRSLGNGDLIDGAWTPGAGTPFAGICLVLTKAASPYRYPRQSLSTQDSSGAPTAHVPWTPVVGNLLIAFLFWRIDADPTIDTSNWDIFETLTHSGADYCIGLRRYVQPGDTSALPAFTTAGSGHHGLEIFEVESVSGDFAEDIISIKKGYQDNATPFVTASDTTSGPNQLTLIGYGEQGTTAQPTVDSAWAYANGSGNNSALGYVWGFAEIFPLSGSIVQATITPGISAEPQGYIQVLFGGNLILFTPPPFLRVD